MNQRRTFVSTIPRLNSLASHPPLAHATTIVFSPTPQQIEDEELDVELIPPKDIKIVVTDRAAEVIILYFICYH